MDDVRLIDADHVRAEIVVRLHSLKCSAPQIGNTVWLRYDDVIRIVYDAIGGNEDGN